MPYKDPALRREKQRGYAKKHYEKNRERIKQATLVNKRLRRKAWDAYKESLSCAHCGISNPALIDFHHVDKTNKESVNLLVKNGRFLRAFEEVKKCIPLCANCHRLVHQRERHKARKKRKYELLHQRRDTDSG